MNLASKSASRRCGWVRASFCSPAKGRLVGQLHGTGVAEEGARPLAAPLLAVGMVPAPHAATGRVWPDRPHAGNRAAGRRRGPVRGRSRRCSRS